jgi:carboxymethylenebutenolidase
MTDIDLSDLAAAHHGSQPLHGYLATPPGAGPWPGVVVIHEIFGLDGVMRAHAVPPTPTWLAAVTARARPV